MTININNNIRFQDEHTMKFPGFFISFLLLLLLFVITPVLADTSGNLLNQGNRLSEQGQYQQALTAYDQSLAQDPDNDITWNNKGNALYHLGRYKDALAAYNEAVAINQQNAYAWNGKGNVLHDLSRYQEAILSYKKALLITPNYALASLGLGNSLFMLDDYQGALSSYNNALSSNPKLTDAWVGKGNCQVRLNNIAEAVQAYDTALALNPSDTNARDNRDLALNTNKEINLPVTPHYSTTIDSENSSQKGSSNTVILIITKVFFPTNLKGSVITLQIILLAVVVCLLHLMKMSRND